MNELITFADGLIFFLQNQPEKIDKQPKTMYN